MVNKDEIFLNYLWISKSLKSALSTLCIFSFILSPGSPLCYLVPLMKSYTPKERTVPHYSDSYLPNPSLVGSPTVLAIPVWNVHSLPRIVLLWSPQGVQRVLNNWASPRNLRPGKGCRGNPRLMEWSLPFSPTEERGPGPGPGQGEDVRWGSLSTITKRMLRCLQASEDECMV